MQVFTARYKMHQTVYTHKVVKQIEFMITDALCLADAHIRIEGSVTPRHPDGLYKMSECYTDMKALSNLNDQILEVIKQDRSQHEGMIQARQLIRRVQMRDLVRMNEYMFLYISEVPAEYS